MADPVVDRLLEIDLACRDLADRLRVLQEACAEIRTMRARGRPASEIVADGRGVRARRDVRASWSRVNEALHGYRACLVVSMIDDEGMSIAEVARLTGNARQVVSRLYHSR
jgi:hypothetical protein